MTIPASGWLVLRGAAGKRLLPLSVERKWDGSGAFKRSSGPDPGPYGHSDDGIQPGKLPSAVGAAAACEALLLKTSRKMLDIAHSARSNSDSVAG